MKLVLSPYFFPAALVMGLRVTSCILVVAAIAAISIRATASQPATRVAVYVGTYTGGASRGIYRFDLDTASGTASVPELAAETTNPSFLAMHPNGLILYAVNEVSDFGGARMGAVSAFAVDAVGHLFFINRQPSGGADPCHLAIDPAGRHVLVANYSSGSLAVLPLASLGRLSPSSSVHGHRGRGADPVRQAGPHSHAVVFDPSGQFVFEADLGTDRIHAFRFDAATGRLTPNEYRDAALPPGAGPRHLAWNPSGRVLYSVNELNSTVTAYHFNAWLGSIEPVQTVSTRPDGFTGPNSAAEIAVLPNGRFLYASNRGHESLAVFAIDPATGRLTPAGHVPTGGKTPRHFAIDPTNRWLLAANQESGSITIFRLDAATGQLSEAGRVAVPDPVCLLFSQEFR
jgi:6-phosphogluconolactonase